MYNGRHISSKSLLPLYLKSQLDTCLDNYFDKKMGIKTAHKLYNNLQTQYMLDMIDHIFHISLFRYYRTYQSYTRRRKFQAIKMVTLFAISYFWSNLYKHLAIPLYMYCMDKSSYF